MEREKVKGITVAWQFSVRQRLEEYHNDNRHDYDSFSQAVNGYFKKQSKHISFLNDTLKETMRQLDDARSELSLYRDKVTRKKI